MNISDYQIIVTTRADVQTAYFSGTGGRHGLVGCEFGLKKNGGCDALTLKLERGHVGTISCGNKIKVKISPHGGSLTQYWIGSITRTAEPDTTDLTLNYRAVGFSEQLKLALITKYYAADDLDDIVEILIGAFNSELDITNSIAQVDIASPVALGDAEFELLSFANVLDLLATVQADVQWGVDENGNVYFKDISTAIAQKFWVGKHVAEFSVDEDRSSVINDIYLQSKQGIGGGLLILHRDDATSVTAYGRRTKLLQIPHLIEGADIWAYGAAYLATWKDPLKRAALKTIAPFTAFQFPRGNVRVYDRVGSYMDLPIEGVKYMLSPNIGLNASLDIGDAPPPELSAQLNELLRRIEINRETAVSLGKIEHSRGEEWMQAARLDAGKQGNLNVYLDSFTDKKGIDQELSRSIYRDEVREYFGTNVDAGGDTLIISKAIPTGQQLDSVRVHLDQDWPGRVNFTFPEDLADFFYVSGGTWSINADEGKVQQTARGGRNRLLYDTDFSLPANFKCNCAWYYQTTSQVAESGLAWNINPASMGDYYYVTLQNGAANMILSLYTVAADVPTLRQQKSLIKNQNYLMELTQSVASISVTCTNIGGSASTQTVTHVVGATAGRYLGLQDLMQGASKDFYVGYFEIPSEGAVTFVGKIEVYVSRDDGTTWTSILNTEATTNKDVNISGQPAGTNLRLKATTEHPCRLYGWGLSFQN